MDLGEGESSSIANLDPQIPERKEPLLHESKEKSLFNDLYQQYQCRYIPEIIHKSKKKKQPQLSIEERRQQIKKLEERYIKLQRSGSLTSESEDEDEDEEIHVPTRSHWFKLCLEQWGTTGGAAIQSRVESSGLVFQIHTAGVFSDDGKSGCGAVLRDSFHRPIAAWSRTVPEACGGISTFYHQMEGVLLGVQMAKAYQVPHFKLYCSSGSVSNFLLVAVRRGAIKCFCGAQKKLDTSGTYCINCLMCRMKTDNKEVVEKGYKLFSEISSGVRELESRGLPYFSVSEVGSERNVPARWMAQLGENKEMDLLQISESESLSDILYKDVFGHWCE